MCPDCGGDPAAVEPREAAAPARIRRKIKQPQPKATRREDKRKARALMVFVTGWVLLLGMGAIVMKKRWSSQVPPADEPVTLSAAELEDQRFFREHLPACEKRLLEFLASPEVGGRALHVLGGGRTVSRMTRVQQFNPIFAINERLQLEKIGVIHTPAGRGIETLWKREEGGLIEAVFFQEEGEWKIDWDAFARAGSEPWPLFLAGRGAGEGEFRLLARERIGAAGRSEEFIGLVLYSTRAGHPGEAIAPSPEIRVERYSPMGRQIAEAFAARATGAGPFGSKVVGEDPDEMIRLRVRVSREGEEQRVFRITELFACHWLELPPEAAKKD